MGNYFVKPPVLVPPLFDSPPLAARTCMLESQYNVLFGKLALKCLFDDYFEEANYFRSRIMLRPSDHPNVDLIATVSGPLDQTTKNLVGKAIFRWQSDVDDPHTFVDLSVSTADSVLQVRSCAYDPENGFGAFCIYPVLMRKRKTSEDYGVWGFRCGSENLSFGTTLVPFAVTDKWAKNAWLVSKIGRLTVGVQYEPLYGRKGDQKYKNLKNWSCAIGYGVGTNPVSPSFNVSLEFAKNSQFIASFYHHLVVQRQVLNPLEENEVRITNYIDLGFEMQTRVDCVRSTNNKFQVAAAWQANKNFLLKGKFGAHSTNVALAFKSWWNPSLNFNISATRDRTGKTAYGFGIWCDNLREASYERADPNYVMLTTNKEHLADQNTQSKGHLADLNMLWKSGKNAMLKCDADLNMHWESGKRAMLESNGDILTLFSRFIVSLLPT